MKKAISKTPRNHKHSRKVIFSVMMREKISQEWIKKVKGQKKAKSKSS